MKTSEKIDMLASSLVKAQKEMVGAVKDSSNPFHKSKYADIASVIDAIKDPLNNNGLSYMQLPVSEDGKVGVSTRLMHESGQWIEDEFLISTGSSKNLAQEAGSIITYARRYALQSLCGIPTIDDDAQSLTSEKVQSPNSGKKKISSDQLKVLSSLVDNISARDGFLTYYSIKEYSELPEMNYYQALKFLHEKYVNAGRELEYDEIVGDV